MRTCSACGHENAESAKFCSECGTSFTAVAPARYEERKVVSVVFVDLVGSTARADASDPEDVRALLRVYHERAREELERFGGTVEKFIGDAVVAVFGAPVAHEDDAERAVRAAIAVGEAVAGLNEDEPGRDLHVRIAVNTGEALVSLDAAPDEGEGMVAGDVVNTAARLQSAAPIDGILVGEQTYRSTDRAIVYREAAAIEAKGKSEPIPVWEAVEARSRFGVDVGGAGRAELVGREAELELLASAFSRSRRERSTQLVTLVGVPGIGKSRLVYELSRLVDADEELITWRQGRSLPYGEGVSFWALGEIVKAQAGILESDPAAGTEKKLEAVVSTLLPDEQERAWVARHLRALVGLGGDETTGDRRGEAFAAWRRFLEALAETGPTVLVFEDLHWADEGLLDFVDGLVDWVDGVPLLVVGTARPELLDRRPGWGGGKRNASTTSLASLDDEATGRLVLALLDRTLIDAEMQQLLVERSAGNPLYAEEFVRMLDAGGTAGARLPESVQGIVAARIDLLSPAEKELLQNAAVLGKVVWSDALAALGDLGASEVAETLRALERKEFVRREHRSAVAGALQHSFVHALVRDAAYLQLPRAARAERHVAAARWIESLPEDRAEDRGETLAHHYLTAIDLYQAAGTDVAELGRRAVPALQEAGARALTLNAYDTAARFLERALALLGPDEEPSPELLLAAGTAFGYLGRTADELTRAVEGFERAGDPERAAEAAVAAFLNGWYAVSGDSRVWLDRAAELLDERPVSRAKVLVLGAQARDAMMSYRTETGSELARQAVELARELGDVENEAYSLITLGCGRVADGDVGGVRDLETALELVGGRGAVASRARNNLGWAYAVIGNQRRAREYSVEAAKQAEQDGDFQTAWFARGNIAMCDYQLGAWDEALEMIDAFDAAPAGARYQRDRLVSVRAWILAARDRGEEGLAQLREAVTDFSRNAVDLQGVWPDLTSYARLALRLGRRAEADTVLEQLVEGLAANESGGEPGWQVELVLALCDADREGQARVVVARLAPGGAREICDAILAGDSVRAADLVAGSGDGDLCFAAELRLRGARNLAAAGRLAEAEAQLELAREFWRSVGATAHLREADELLAAAI
jgi:class 3 adenylate cyclase/tetratricopeptide (TPR) repeat protein